MAVFGQKHAKWGQSKQLWYPNPQTFFDEVIIFELVGDDVKFATFLLALLEGRLNNVIAGCSGSQTFLGGRATKNNIQVKFLKNYEPVNIRSPLISMF